MVRLVFRPYTQIRRTICTSVSLRASTRVSPGFTLFRHRSPSFGSQQICSYSNLSQVMIGRQCLPFDKDSYLSRTSSAFTFITHQGFSPKYLHRCQTPWSVFQDGSIKTISYKIVMAHRITTPSIAFPHRDSIAIGASRTTETQDQAASGAPLLPQSKPRQSNKNITEEIALLLPFSLPSPTIRIDLD